MASIDPDELMKMGAKTVDAGGAITTVGGDAQNTIDSVSDLPDGRPSVRPDLS